MGNKEIHYPYYCKKCARTVYFGENDLKNNICKCCGCEMEEEAPIISHPKDAIKNVNRKGSCLTVSPQIVKPLVECPYCHSTNTKKISGLSKAGSVALFGIFALGKTSKQWHCNNCDSNF